MTNERRALLFRQGIISKNLSPVARSAAAAPPPPELLLTDVDDCDCVNLLRASGNERTASFLNGRESNDRTVGRERPIHLDSDGLYGDQALAIEAACCDRPLPTTRPLPTSYPPSDLVSCANNSSASPTNIRYHYSPSRRTQEYRALTDSTAPRSHSLCGLGRPVTELTTTSRTRLTFHTTTIRHSRIL